MPIYTINKMTFNSADIEKSGSHPSPRHTYRFTSEKGVDFILPCISDSGNARTLVAQDLLEEKSIEYYETDADEHLIAPNGTDMHISGCVMLAARDGTRNSSSLDPRGPGPFFTPRFPEE